MTAKSFQKKYLHLPSAAWKTIAAAVFVVLAGSLAFHNSFSGEFLFDDRGNILQNPDVAQWPPWEIFIKRNRPLVYFSFALNHHWGGFDVRGYHWVNLLTHLFSALTLMGILRRTLKSPRLVERFGARSLALAVMVATLWVVHPLQTGSVTYIAQRFESLMGLFYLLALYCAIRSISASRGVGWSVASVVFCLLGTLTKEIIVTAPVVTLLYHRTFFARSFKDALRQRGKMYMGLFSSWIIILVSLLTVYPKSEVSAGFDFEGITPLQYTMAQPGIIFHYLKLCFWPHPLVLDYHWGVPSETSAVIVPALGIAVLLILTIRGVIRKTGWGFLGAWFFLILAPSSSIMPIADLAFEHRMYLPLAAVIALVVLAIDSLLIRIKLNTKRYYFTGAIVLLIFATALVCLTSRRNADYSDRITMWNTVLKARPNNPRAYFNLGLASFEREKYASARDYYQQALILKPDYAKAHNNLGDLLYKEGKGEEALPHFEAAVKFRPDYFEAHNNLCVLYYEKDRFENSRDACRQALRLEPENIILRNTLGAAYMQLGDWDAARAVLEEAIALDPKYETARHNLEILQKRQQKDITGQ